ncbi:signal transduction histidine kinase [Arthrobacter sp. UYEF6]
MNEAAPWGTRKPVRPTRWFALVAMAAATAPLALLYLLAAVGPMESSFIHDAGGNPGDFHLLTSIATIALSNVIATGIGISVRQRREHEQEIAAWVARTASLASVNERNRIAREMHDVVAHSLTVMVSLSDGAAVVVRKSPDRAGEVLGELSRTGRTALADMRSRSAAWRSRRKQRVPFPVPIPGAGRISTSKSSSP